jgi:GTPase SAR1 family protein
MTTPRLLLFGSPGAGKTSLLGALAQAAPGLKGQFVDPSGAWGRLQKSTYEAPTLATDQLASYDFKLLPIGDGSAGVEVKILDCSGKSAAEMLRDAAPFAAAHPLKKSVLGADGILLLVDMSLPKQQLSDEFRRFGQWLAELYQTRGKLALVGDLPIYLVLTKCDALGKKDETINQWKQRVEDLKRTLDEQFHKILKDEGESFGSLDVKLWATAIKRPAFIDQPASPREPYGVAELFRQCFDSAHDFARRRQTSQSRLHNILVGLTGAVALLGLSLAFLVEYKPDTRSAALEEQVQTVLPRKDAKAPQRLGGTLKKLGEKQKRLAEIATAQEFVHLPAESRDSVQKYRQEIEQYLEMSDEFKTKAKFPFMAKTEQDFLEREKAVAGLALRPDWDQTPLGKRAAQCRKEYAAVHQAIAEREAWLSEQTAKNNALLKQGFKLQLKLSEKMKLGPQEAELWDVQYRNQMQARPTALQSDTIPGVSGVTYEFLDQFQSIKDARKRWDAVKTQLRRVAENIQDELKGN